MEAYLNGSINDTTSDVPTWPGVGLSGHLTEAALFVITLVVCFLNGIVFDALTKITDDNLKVRFLVQNSVIADMLLAVSLGSGIILQILKASKLDVEIVNMCGTLAYNVFGYFCTFFQIFASMAVAIDRFFSVFKPFEYHILRYGKCLKATVISAIWGTTFALVIPIVLLKISPKGEILDICYQSDDSHYYSDIILPLLLLLGVFITICTYLSILVLLVVRRKRQNALVASDARQNQVSMTLTFFLVHISYVVFYVPGALYHSVLGNNVKYNDPHMHFYISRLLIALYLSNCIIDPCIYVIRIRVIRNRIQKTFRSTRTIRENHDSTEMSYDKKETVFNVATITDGIP